MSSETAFETFSIRSFAAKSSIRRSGIVQGTTEIQGARRYALRGDLLAGERFERISGGWIIVNGDSIEAVLPSDASVPAEERHEFPGCSILPGLIDTHCHLTLPGDGRDVDRYLNESRPDLQLAVAARNAESALLGGVTTVRDLGSPGDVALRLREAADQGFFRAPRLVLAGPVLTETGGHGHTFGIEVDSPIEIRKAIRRLRRDGVDVIKVMASGGSTPGTSRWRPAFTVDLLTELVAEAHGRGLPVTAHVSCPQAIENALRAGVDGLEHANFWIDGALHSDIRVDLLEEMAARSVDVAPTLQTSYHILNTPGFLSEADRMRRKKILDDAYEGLARMIERGISIVAGSDAGFLVTRFDELWLGLKLMIDCGMPPIEAICSATTRAAKAVGLAGIVGVVAPGYQADLVVVEGDALSDIESLSHVRAVFLAGERIR
jgi:imidazolonepropionase-like amidohydrolase